MEPVEEALVKSFSVVDLHYTYILGPYKMAVMKNILMEMILRMNVYQILSIMSNNCPVIFFQKKLN